RHSSKVRRQRNIRSTRTSRVAVARWRTRRVWSDAPLSRLPGRRVWHLRAPCSPLQALCLVRARRKKGYRLDPYLTRDWPAEWFAFRLFSRMVRVRQYRERVKFWKYVLEQLNSFCRQLERQEGAAREITARLAQASDDAQRNRVAAKGKQHGNV